MEFARSSEDFCAGYLQEDSDLEFSNCSEEVSSDEGEGGGRRCTVPAVRPPRRGRGEGGGGEEEWSEDEFERDMESELMGLLQTVTSPDALAAAMTSSGPVKGRSRKRRKAPVAKPQSRPLSSELTSSGVSGGGGEKEGHQTVGEGEGAREGEGEESQLDKAGAYYDKLYFETSSSEDDGEEEEDGGGGTVTDKGKRKERRKGRMSEEQRLRQRQRLTDEELFYDPHMDEEDEQWVKRQRMAYHNVKVSERLKEEQEKRMAGQKSSSDSEGVTGGTWGQMEGGGGGRGREQGHLGAEMSGSLPKRSDAHLSCPACMTTVCIDCQQHAHYSNQFRAMFVMNCRVNREEVLRHVPRLTKKEKQRKRWRKGRRGGEGGGGEGSGREEEGVDEYHPVHCAECNTEIAVYDKDEVFHFYNVLASAAS